MGILLNLCNHLFPILIENIIEHHLHVVLCLVGKVLAIAGFHTETVLHPIQRKALCRLHQAQLLHAADDFSLLTINRNIVLAHIVDNLLLYLTGDAILVGCLEKHIVLYQQSYGTLHLVQNLIILFRAAGIRTGDILYRGTGIRLGKEIDDLQELLAFHDFKTAISLDMVFSLLVTDAE